MLPGGSQAGGRLSVGSGATRIGTHRLETDAWLDLAPDWIVPLDARQSLPLSGFQSPGKNGLTEKYRIKPAIRL